MLKKNEIIHQTHLFLLIYSYTHFYNPKKYSQQIHTINLQKKKSQLLNQPSTVSLNRMRLPN